MAHKWDTSQLRGMKIEEEIDQSLINLPYVIDPRDAERFVEELVKFDIEEIGNSKWMEQHRRIEKLNLQAHQSASSNSDEFVLEEILTFSKLDVLIHNLLAIEAWKENIYPKLLDEIAGRNTMRVYFILYHEATLVNLFEVLLYHKHVVESGGEKLIELVDYFARKLTRLQSGYEFRTPIPKILSDDKNIKDIADEISNRTPHEELLQYFAEIEFKVCVSCCALIRFLCEHAEAVPLSVVSRITDTHDMLILIVPLIENPPWTRRINGKWQKLIDQNWKDVQPIDLMKLTKLEGQPWLCLYHLMAKQVFRERYHLNSFRKGQLLRLRKYLNEILLDQLPFLADIQRYMDELALTQVPEPHEVSNSIFMFQQVAVTREKIIKNKNWDEIAQYQMKNVFTMTDKDDKDLKILADLYSDDFSEFEH